MDPAPRNPIEKDRIFPGHKDGSHPPPKNASKPTCLQDHVKGAPIDRVEGLPEVELQHDHGGAPDVAALDEVGRIEKVVGDVPSSDETSLLKGNKFLDTSLQAGCEDQGYNLHDTVLERDGAEPVCGDDVFLLGEKGNECSVDAVQGGGPGMERLQECHEVRPYRVPERAEEIRTEAVGTRATIHLHGPKGILGFLHGEGSVHILEAGHAWKECSRVYVPHRRGRGAKESGVEAEQHPGNVVMVVEGSPALVQHTDLIFPKTRRRVGVEELGVVLPQTAEPVGESLPPVYAELLVLPREVSPDKVSKQVLGRQEWADLLHKVQGLNDAAAGCDHLRRPTTRFGPFFRRRTDPLESITQAAGCDHTSSGLHLRAIIAH